MQAAALGYALQIDEALVWTFAKADYMASAVRTDARQAPARLLLRQRQWHAAQGVGLFCGVHRTARCAAQAA